MNVNDDAKATLETELKTLEEQKTQSEKKYKNQMAKLDAQLKQLGHELQILGVKLKEKDQEVKLNDLKIKELKKQVPNTKLKPLQLMNGQQSETASVASRKDIRHNLSVDSKILGGTSEKEQDSIISESR